MEETREGRRAVSNLQERSLPSSRDEYQQRRDERRSVDHGAPFQRDMRARPASPETMYSDKSRMGDKDAEPSEVLWIGFPSFLNVDEMLLRRSFSPYGEIEKITAFPGRSYAFVQFRNLAAACRAKEALQGKLFNNPRVSICFAKSEMNSHEHGRNSMNPPFSPHFKSSGHPGAPMEYRQDRNFGNSVGETYGGSPRFSSDLESGDSSFIGFNRKAPAWTGGSGSFEPMNFPGQRPQLGLTEDVYERQISPSRERGPQRHDFSPGRRPRKNPFFEDLSGMQDNYVFQEAKKQRTGPFPPDNELPEYPFSNSAQDKHHSGLLSTLPNLPEHGSFEQRFGSGPSNHNRVTDRPMNMAHLHDERNDNWNAPFDRFEGSGSLPTNPPKLRISTPEPHLSPLKGEWKWEGTIAKGGTPVCRARCFPVGKVLDVMLPTFLDCTARTGLDMLTKHFYQAASSWVVFFVPESDADITLYNEFMDYLGQKKRVAVAKLGEKTTLFLVPPSDFSEKVLKVPGKLSISGVILRFQDVNSEFGSLNQPLEAMDSKLPSFQEDVSYLKPPPTDLRASAWGPNQSYPNQSYSNISSESFPSSTSFPNQRKPDFDDLPFMGNMPGSAFSAPLPGSTHVTARGPEALNDSRYYHPPQHQQTQYPSNWSHDMSNSNPGTGNLPPQISSKTAVHSAHLKPGILQETNPSHLAPGISDTSFAGSKKFSPQVSTSVSHPSLQPDQLAQLATLLVQRQQPGSGSGSSFEEGHKQTLNQRDNSYPSSQKSSQNQASSNASTVQFGQVQQFLQQKLNAPAVSQTSSADSLMGALQSQLNQPLHTSSAQEEGNPHTRLQATLQLAATLLQQIQHQAKGSEQR
ncbi:hypothetical protein AQUCO_01000562v1 [Aquilegia coerulea]|uniref:RRM domain-containing protein n=1 Tax=Aquilegia coerulea TaxID=218851 RepID=A0A2G5EB33_AQUCA|nr:hypothetical protein AQUCO_01000562v1 [Aquilegia coerulea]